MSDLVKQFKTWLPTMTAQDRADALKVVEEQIQMNMANVQDMAKHLDGATAKYAQAWGDIIEKRRIDINELEQVKQMLKSKA
jgi:polyhydroxyalkanoate synthesis regulator protein